MNHVIRAVDDESYFLSVHDLEFLELLHANLILLYMENTKDICYA